MAGILDWLGVGNGNDPSQGGILGQLPQQSQAPQQSPWGLIGATLKDVGAQLGGRPEDANNVSQYGQIMARQQLARGINSTDPNVRSQAYSQALAMGIDPKPFEQQQAQAAMPQLLHAMQPQQQVAPVTVTPQVSAQVPLSDPSRAAAMQSGVSAPSLSDALGQVNSPELSAQMAPQIIQDQLTRQKSKVRAATPAEMVAHGYDATDPGTINDYTGELSSPVKPKAAIQQTYDIAKNTPRTAEDIAKDAISKESADAAVMSANKPIAVAMGDTVISPRTGQPIGGTGAMGLPMAQGGKLSSNIADYPANLQPVIAGMLKGTIAPPQGAALRSPQVLQLISAASAVDPSFDETKWSARNKMAVDAGGNGAWGKGMNALGTATQHVAALGGYAANTFSTPVPQLNWLLNGGINPDTNTNIGKFSGPTVYADAAHKVGEEYTRAYRGAGGSVDDIKSSMGALSPNAPSSTKNAVIDENMNLARDKMAENVNQYNNTMGTNKKISDFVSPQTVAAYAARGIDINSGAKLNQQGQSSVPPLNPSQLPQKAGAGWSNFRAH